MGWMEAWKFGKAEERMSEQAQQYNRYWLPTRYKEVKKCVSDSTTYISSVKAIVPSDPTGILKPPWNFDAPRHTPYRTLQGH
ncbi:hypothetical protein BDZ45DRAFT_752446 [Acephala macrosclerotiorum]|nr:hypothetical protein BDZ45DRAFT_752446 [Acephala macrosclerotiorum]